MPLVNISYADRRGNPEYLWRIPGSPRGKKYGIVAAKRSKFVQPSMAMLFLIVDDSEKSLDFMRRVITEMGHQVVGTARDGLSAVQQYQSLHPDVVIMDLIMPRMNGREALREIRRMDSHAKIVMASATRSPQSALDCQRDGASFFLYKPFDTAEMRNVINKLDPNQAIRLAATDVFGVTHHVDQQSIVFAEYMDY